jgi:hypothetical protein
MRINIKVGFIFETYLQVFTKNYQVVFLFIFCNFSSVIKMEI